MIITGSIITAIVVLLVISLILFYNGMVRGRNMVEEAWSGISVQLKRRHDLVPVLVNSVKGYMTHEQETLTRIAELRASAVSASSWEPCVPCSPYRRTIPTCAPMKISCSSRSSFPCWRTRSSCPAVTTTARPATRTIVCCSFPAIWWLMPLVSTRFELADPAEAAVPEVKF